MTARQYLVQSSERAMATKHSSPIGLERFKTTHRYRTGGGFLALKT